MGIPDLGGVCKFLGNCILYLSSIFPTLIHSQEGEDWPQSGCSFNNYRCASTFAKEGGAHGREKPFKEVA